MCLRKLQSALPDLIGRTIKHVVVCAHEDQYTQIFLHFTDGTYYELYGATVCGIRHLDVGGLEITRANGYIPVNGRLDVIDANTASLVQRPTTKSGA